MPPTCHPVSTSRRSTPGRARSRGSAPPSPPSSASPTRGPFNTPTLISNWTPVHSTFGDFVEGTLPGPRRLRLLPQRRRQLLRRPGRRRRQRLVRRPRRDRAPAAPQAALGQPAAGRRRRRRTCAAGELEVEVADGGRRGADRRHVQAGRQARRQGRRGVRPADHQARQAERRHVVNAESKLIKIEEVGSGAVEKPDAGTVAARAARAAGRRAVAVADRRRLRRRRRRPHRLRRPRDHRRGHDGLRPRPDERLPAGRDRPRGRAGRAARR